ncbi:MAG: cytochrome c biogenesis protein CcdA [Candidatus Ornithospirochaeta sp.]|nr:cytochrome c biogenesis protein CcdA [Candidatus Ornithospirochaeta sp.]
MPDSMLSPLAASLAASGWEAFALAFAAGIAASLTPCSLSTLPLVIGYVSGSDGPAFRLSLAYASGSAVTFTILGIAASALGRMIGVQSRIYYIILGAFMLFFALQMWHVISLPGSRLQGLNRKRGYIGALSAGVLSGIFSSPCTTPMLASILTLAITGRDTARGAIMLLLYSAGNTALSIAAGTSSSFVRKLARSGRMHALSRFLEILLGGLAFLLGLYMLYLGF